VIDSGRKRAESRVIPKSQQVVIGIILREQRAEGEG
jgi:hypothetical protein